MVLRKGEGEGKGKGKENYWERYRVRKLWWLSIRLECSVVMKSATFRT
jgi:hypothetical protein